MRRLDAFLFAGLMTLMVLPCAASAQAEPAVGETAGEAPAPALTRNAQPGPQRSVADALQLEAGQTCLEEARLERRVARWLERDRINADISVVVTGGSTSNQARFVLRRGGAPPTERVLADVPGDCGDQHSAVALSIALAIDASLLGPLPPSDEASPPGNESAEPRPAFAVSAGGGFGVGFLTDVAPAALLAVHLEPVRGLELRATGRWTGQFGASWPETTLSYSEQLFSGGLAACPVVRPLPSLSAAACLELLGGVFRTRASGVLDTRIQNGAYWAAGVGLDFRAYLNEWMGVRLVAELMLPFAQRSLRVAKADGTTDKERRLLPASVFLGLAPFVAF